MLFNSSQFLCFFAVIVVVYFSIPHRWRWVLLLGASYYFYMCWKPEYVLLIMVSTLYDYFLGLAIGGTKSAGLRKAYLFTSLTLNCGLLFVFKYYNFLSESLETLLECFDLFPIFPILNVALPVGISFYIFQKLSYIIDVYRKEKEPEHHLGIFALYVVFFPQLVAGPIERSVRLLPQFHQHHFFDYTRVTDGLKLMAWGLFKKMVIADRIAVTVDIIYGSPSQFSGAAVLIATYLFAFQIYCDFSGYSDIAIGTSRVLGFDLMENFKRPYLATSVSEFWRRWHISLSTWFRDYLYIPLGGNRSGMFRTYYNIIMVFLICGLWHGANWTFVAWGAFHGLAIMLERQLGSLHRFFETMIKGVFWGKSLYVIKLFFTFHIICLGWILFRSNSISDSLIIFKKIFIEISVSDRYGIGAGFSGGEYVSLLVLLLFMISIDLLKERGFKIREQISLCSFPIRWSVYSIGIISILIFGIFSSTSEFIYFQF